MKKSIGLVLFSGGQDSTTCLFWALTKFDEVELITFNYGQKHSVELDCAKNIAEIHRLKQTIVDISFLGTLVESALTSNGDVNVLNPKGLPASFVPNRNQLFITLAHAYAQKIGAGYLVIGACETDYSGYPDCRMEFIEQLQSVTNLGSDSFIEIEAPLMYLTKAETWRLADELGKLREVRELSHTCYNGIRTELHAWGYGCSDEIKECPACKLRRKGYYEWLEEFNGKV